MKKSYNIRVTGIVQGVGFRPFIFRLAHQYQIAGEVLNDTHGVFIRAEGIENNLNKFIKAVSKEAPPLSKIDQVNFIISTPKNYKDFQIVQSKMLPTKSTFIPPDTMLCKDCLAEYKNKLDKRFNYPFITCTHCGPRFSIIKDIPYDRKNTEMDPFPLCPDCENEYQDPLNRRFHTEPNACPKCGPTLFLYNNKKELLINGDLDKILKEAIKNIKSGKIIAIKGVGGYHLACDATNSKAIKTLRKRKKRPFKPFALMVGNINKAEEIALISPEEKKLLLSKERPILLLKEKPATSLSVLVAPDLTFQGIMLPYTPFQHSLFLNNPEEILIMTSANISNEPIIYSDNEIFKKMGNIADLFITYNRKIHSHSDDSVLFVLNENPYFIRRSKGYVPVPFFSSPTKVDILATGADLKNCFGIAKNNFMILSQHTGDLKSPSTEKTFTQSVKNFTTIYDLKPKVVVCDKHPSYFTTSIADQYQKKGLKNITVFHHHAHIASVLEEHNLKEKVIGLAFDGTGYGKDGNIWGSEFLIADPLSFKRAGHFSYFPLPGGEKAIKEVYRIGLSLLYLTYKNRIPKKLSPQEKRIIDLIKKKINSPLCCSIGRIFDGISNLLGIIKIISSEAQAAIKLEETALTAKNKKLSFKIDYSDEITKDYDFIIHTQSIVKNIMDMVNKKINIGDIAYAFHLSLADITIKLSLKLRVKYQINKIVLSGGVFQNRLFLELLMDGLLNNNFKVLTPKEIPFNDGCIALGQLSIAKAILENQIKS